MPATTVKIVIQGSVALRELEGVTRRTDSAATAERKLAQAAERSAKIQAKAAQDSAAAATKAAKDKQKASDRLASNLLKNENAHAKASERTSARQKKASESAAKAAQRAAAEKAKADAKAAKESARSADNELRARLRNLDRLRSAREQAEAQATANAKREAAKRLRTEEQTNASRRRSAERTLRTAGGIVGGVIAGAVTGGAMAANTARGIAGVDDAATRVKRANEFKQNLIITAADAGMSRDQTEALQGKITGAAMASATDPTELMSGLAIGHERFNQLKLFSETLDKLAVSAKAAQTPFDDFIGMTGAAASAYGLTAGQIEEATNIILAGAKEGAISPKDFSGAMASSMGIHAQNTGQRGIEGLRQFVGLMQGVGAGQFGANETETRGTQFIGMLNRKNVADDLKRIGVKVRGKDGKIDIGSVVDQLATNKQFQTPTQRQAIFHDMQAREGVETLINQRRKVLAKEAGAVDFKSMHGVDAKIGADSTVEKMSRLQDSGLLDLQRKAVEMQNDTILHLREYNDQIVSVTGATNKLEKEFGVLGLWASEIGVGGAVTAGGVLLTTGGPAVAAAATVGAGVVGLGIAGEQASDRYIADQKLPENVRSSLVNSANKPASEKSWWESFVSNQVDPERYNLNKEHALQAKDSGERARVEGEIKTTVAIDLRDNRTETKVKQEVVRERGAKINTGAGPSMAGAGQ